MKKYLLSAVAPVLFVLAIYLTFYDSEKIGIIINERPTDFAEKGTLVINIPTVDQPEMPRLIYEKPGQPALYKKLIFDETSICGSIPCMAMSASLDVAFAGKRIGVEGIINGTDAVLVKKLTKFNEGELEYDLQIGSVFIPWMKAVEIIRQCQVGMLTQAHSLDVYLVLNDGRNLRTVEPQIDELFVVYNSNKDRCGEIPIGTE